VWKVFVEQRGRPSIGRPSIQYYEKPYPNKLSALKRALAIYRHPIWGLSVLFIEGPNEERIEAVVIRMWCKRAAG
jgi:hypothetical protein